MMKSTPKQISMDMAAILHFLHRFRARKVEEQAKREENDTKQQRRRLISIKCRHAFYLLTLFRVQKMHTSS